MSQIGAPTPPPVNSQFQMLLHRWETEVRPLEREGWDAQRMSQEFAKLGLSSALILNGGGLVALPPLMQWLDAAGRSQVAGAAIWFPVGIFCAAAALVLAYANHLAISVGRYAMGVKRARELDQGYLGKTPAGDPEFEKAVKKIARTSKIITGTQITAVLLAIASYVMFGIGVFGFIEIGKSNKAVVEEVAAPQPMTMVTPGVTINISAPTATVTTPQQSPTPPTSAPKAQTPQQPSASSPTAKPEPPPSTQ